MHNTWCKWMYTSCLRCSVVSYLMYLSKYWYSFIVDLNRTDELVANPAIVTGEFIFATILCTDIFLISLLTSMIIVPSGKLRPFTSTLWSSLGEWMRYKPCHDVEYEVMTPSKLQNGIQISSLQSNPGPGLQRNFHIKTHVSFSEF